MNTLINKNNTFEDIRHIDENGDEFWYARELMTTLGYQTWENFYNAIGKAIISCNSSKIPVYSHFRDITKMVKAGIADKPISDYILTRYACYLIAQNGDITKKEISLAQSYFAIQTRRQELNDEQFKLLSEDEKRYYNRTIAKTKNRDLTDTAKKAGVANYAKFNNFGYIGLYNETASGIKKRKGLEKKDNILDNMVSEELGANIFRITQTEAKLKKDLVNSEEDACNTHKEVGRAVRNTIKELGGTMPENLPTPEKSIKDIEKEIKKIEKTKCSKELSTKI